MFDVCTQKLLPPPREQGGKGARMLRSLSKHRHDRTVSGTGRNRNLEALCASPFPFSVPLPSAAPIPSSHVSYSTSGETDSIHAPRSHRRNPDWLSSEPVSPPYPISCAPGAGAPSPCRSGKLSSPEGVAVFTVRSIGLARKGCSGSGAPSAEAGIPRVAGGTALALTAQPGHWDAQLALARRRHWDVRHGTSNRILSTLVKPAQCNFPPH